MIVASAGSQSQTVESPATKIVGRVGAATKPMPPSRGVGPGVGASTSTSRVMPGAV